MNRNIEEITQEVINLPNSERLKLVQTLLLLDDQKLDSNIDSRWQEEITKRVLSVESGHAKGIKFEESIQNIRQRLSQ
jgi:hypothetical protein